MPFRFMRSGFCALALLSAFAIVATAAQAAELVMFRRDGCPYCVAWERQIGPVYPKTDVGRRAPLRILDLDRSSDPALQIKSPIIYTPTFLLVDHGVEVGRIEGYPGDASFWGLLDALLDKLPQDRTGQATSTSAPAGRSLGHLL